MNLLNRFDTNIKYTNFPTWNNEVMTDIAFSKYNRLFKLLLSCGASCNNSLILIHAINHDINLFKMSEMIAKYDLSYLGMINEKALNNRVFKLVRCNENLSPLLLKIIAGYYR